MKCVGTIYPLIIQLLSFSAIRVQFESRVSYKSEYESSAFHTVRDKSQILSLSFQTIWVVAGCTLCLVVDIDPYFT